MGINCCSQEMEGAITFILNDLILREDIRGVYSEACSEAADKTIQYCDARHEYFESLLLYDSGHTQQLPAKSFSVLSVEAPPV